MATIVFVPNGRSNIFPGTRFSQKLGRRGADSGETTISSSSDCTPPSTLINKAYIVAQNVRLNQFAADVPANSTAALMYYLFGSNALKVFSTRRHATGKDVR
jgi:hypothetical protein